MRYLVVALVLASGPALAGSQFDFSGQRIRPLVDPRPLWQQRQGPLYDSFRDKRNDDHQHRARDFDDQDDGE